ncbi:hypothetical protein PN473_16630, partial [Dolichospermum circinale CS-545/17]|nr:hypothetical protein [Dolichospermum circinale CS-545/17]
GTHSLLYRVDGSVPYWETDDPVNPNESSSLTHYIFGDNDEIIGKVYFENFEFVGRDNNNVKFWETKCQTKYLTREAIEEIERGEYCHSVNVFKKGFLNISPIQINWLPNY